MLALVGHHLGRASLVRLRPVVPAQYLVLGRTRREQRDGVVEYAPPIGATRQVDLGLFKQDGSVWPTV